MNWLQTNGVIYLPVVVTHPPNAGTMLCQHRGRWPNNVPALGECLLFATSWKGTVSCV